MGFFSNDNMGMTGYAVTDTNCRLRFFLIIFMGMMALGAVLFWRSRLLMSAEYVDVPMVKHLQKSQLDKYLNE
jgi:hypothetical protein